MSTCQHRGFNNVCALLERGGAREGGYPTLCPHPEVHGLDCGLVGLVDHWTESELRRSGRGCEATQAQRDLVKEEVLPQVVLVFCEHEV